MNVLITGASGGIGKALAAEFEGHSLALQYNKNAISVKDALCIKCDLRSEEEIESMFTRTEKELGTVDVLINNCGISEFSFFDKISLESWNNMLAVNLTSAFLTSKRAVPGMISKKSGSIVNIASIWGETGASCEVHYSASKGGLIAMTKALAKELAPSGIRVNCVSPGIIHTEMNSRLSPDEVKAFLEDVPMGRMGTPNEVSQAVKFLAMEGTYITGQVLGVSGGFL